MRTERFKYITRDKQPAELYDLAADPGETWNVIARVGPDEARELRRIAAGVTASRIDSDDGRARLDDEMVERLKALGYVP